MTEISDTQAVLTPDAAAATEAVRKAETAAPDASPAPSAEIAASAPLTWQEGTEGCADSCGGSSDCADGCSAAAEEAALARAREQAEQDIRELSRLFPEAGITCLEDMDAPARFAHLRAGGLTVEEAYLATNFNRLLRTREELHREAGKSHMRSARVAAVSCTGRIPPAELLRARDMFGNLPDKEIERLYRKVQ